MNIWRGCDNNYDNKEQTKELKGFKPCRVEDNINRLLIKLKYLFGIIKQHNFALERFKGIEKTCKEALYVSAKIEALALVLHPEYDIAKIDDYSLNKFFDDEGEMVKIYFVNITQSRDFEEVTTYRYFKPERDVEGL